MYVLYVDDENECSAVCWSDPRCGGWVFERETSGKCHLKDHDYHPDFGDTDKFIDSADHVTGAKSSTGK